MQDLGFVDVEHAGFRCDEHESVARDHIARGPQAVAIECRADRAAIAERDQRRTFPCVEKTPAGGRTAGLQRERFVETRGVARALGQRRPAARIQLRLPLIVLISPLCASSRNGCVIGHEGSVFVLKR